MACDAIRRYDKNHLIFGDRYDLATPMPEPVIDTAAEFIDAIAVQLSSKMPFEDISPTMTRWSERTGLPYIVADAIGTHKRDRLGVGYHDPAKYDFLLNAMREDRHCLGEIYAEASCEIGRAGKAFTMNRKSQTEMRSMVLRRRIGRFGSGIRV